jgi:hypothetical protein
VGKLKEKKYEDKKLLFASLKSMKKGVGSGVGPGSGSISQRYGSEPHKISRISNTA